MRIWVKKENDLDPYNAWTDSLVFSINRDTGSSLFSNLPILWYHLGSMELNPIYEDLYIIALSIYGTDKRIARSNFPDNWTRSFSISIPVLQHDVWQKTESLWNKTLSFLTGDQWAVSFRPTSSICSRRTRNSRIKTNVSSCDSVCLFSGGLDSFCGAIYLLENGRSPCLIGHNEYPKLRAIQEKFATSFRKYYPEQNTQFLGFTAGARAPYNAEDGNLISGFENTSRGRSLLFLACALTIASIVGNDVPVFIPENGFIGLNIPLTSSRIGSCSTRTTHPYFISEFRRILKYVGIMNSIDNFFSYNTKREIVQMVANSPAFLEGYKETISCSHPCINRYNRTGSREYPINCGYCYPCLIRKASLLDVADGGEYSYDGSPFSILSKVSDSSKGADLAAVINSAYRFKHSSPDTIDSLIYSTGPIGKEELGKFKRLYINGMKDIVEYFVADSSMEKYINGTTN